MWTSTRRHIIKNIAVMNAAEKQLMSGSCAGIMKSVIVARAKQ
jgi:hypothetical protein